MLSPILLLVELTGFDDFGNYPKTTAWMKGIKALPYFDECNKEGLSVLATMYNDGLKKRKE